jgi:pentatricopeptide repeat protein
MGLGAPGVKSYSLLIENLSRHNLGDRANALFREAVARGVPLTQGVYKVDKRYVKAKKEKKAKKRLTLPEKMRLKSKRLYKLRMSFIKKPRRRMQA